MNCPQCDAVVGEDYKFCQHCGAELDPPPAPMREFVASRLREEVQRALKSQTRNQLVVEIETAQAVVSRLTEWAKLFAFSVGIPATITVALLAFFGFKTYSDFAKVAEAAKEAIQSQVDAVSTKVADISETADQLQTEVDDLSKVRDELRREQESLASQQEVLATQQDTLETQLTSVAEQMAGLQQDVSSQLNDVRTDFDELERRLLDFESSAALTPEIEKHLETLAANYDAYLTGVGFELEDDPVNVRVDPDLLDNTNYYPDSNRLVLGPVWAEDSDVVLREYNHHALAAQVGGTIHFETLESALADYFSCSFHDDPRLGETVVAKLIGVQSDYWSNRGCIRNLDNQLKFTDAPDESHAQGEVLGAIFWDIRELLGQEETDKLLLAAWVSLNASRPSGDERVNFANVLITKAAMIKGGEYVDAIRAMFTTRELNVTGQTGAP